MLSPCDELHSITLSDCEEAWERRVGDSPFRQGRSGGLARIGCSVGFPRLGYAEEMEGLPSICYVLRTTDVYKTLPCTLFYLGLVVPSTESDSEAIIT